MNLLKILGISVVAFLLFGSITTVLVLSEIENYTAEDFVEISLREEFELEEITNIIAETNDIDVVVSKEDRTSVLVEFEGNVPEEHQENYIIRNNIRNNELEIYIGLEQQQRSFFGGLSFNWSQRKGIAQITLPLSYTNSAELKTVSGSVEASDLNLDDLSISTVSGDSFLKNGEVNTFGLNTTSGDTTIENSSMNVAKTEAISGSFNSINSQINEITGNSVSGDFNFEKIDLSSINYSFNTTSGDVDIKDLISWTSDLVLQINTVSGDIDSSITYKSNGEAASSIILNSVSGDLNISE